MGQDWEQKDRRRYERIKKHFILSYFKKDDPKTKHEMSQLKNISKGGVCFMTAQKYAPSTKLVLELKTPYLSDTTHLEGTVLESYEKLPNIMYETRLEFDPLSPQSEVLLDKIVEHFRQGEKK